MHFKVDLQELIHLLHPTLLDKCDMIGMIIIGLVILHGIEHHGKTILVIILLTHLVEYLEMLHHRDTCQDAPAVSQELLCSIASGIMFEREDHAMLDLRCTKGLVISGSTPAGREARACHCSNTAVPDKISSLHSDEFSKSIGFCFLAETKYKKNRKGRRRMCASFTNSLF